MKKDYKKEIDLWNEEIPAAINLETGEVRTIMQRPNNIPEGKEVFENKAKFIKCYTNTGIFLQRYLTSEELGIVMTMIMLSDQKNCSLKPLDDKTTVEELMSLFDISEKKVKSTFIKLHQLGVYGKFDIKPQEEFSLF